MFQPELQIQGSGIKSARSKEIVSFEEVNTMKKIVLFIFLLSFCITEGFAGYDYKVVNGGAKYSGTYSYSASSVTATQVTNARSDMRDVLIKNTESFSVWVATYAATSKTGLFELKADSSLSDDVQAYRSSWYILGGAGQATSTIDVIEKWGY